MDMKGKMKMNELNEEVGNLKKDMDTFSEMLDEYKDKTNKDVTFLAERLVKCRFFLNMAIMLLDDSTEHSSCTEEHKDRFDNLLDEIKEYDDEGS